MYNGLIIEELLFSRRIPQKALLECLGRPMEGGTSSIRQIIHGNPTVKSLEPIADFFQISMDSFFKRAVSFTPLSTPAGASPTDNEYEIKIKLLEKLLEEKEKRIETLQTLVNTLLK